MGVPWFLWSKAIPGGSFRSEELRWEPVKECASKEEREALMEEYRAEVDKAYPRPSPPPGHTGSWMVSGPSVSLKCSPVNPGALLW